MAGLAYTLVSTAYYFIAGPALEQAGPAAGPTRETQGSTGLPPVGWQAIAQANLFGTLSKAAPKPAEPVVQEVARETRLPLTLLGVFRADDPDESAAIVAEKGKTGKRYQVGRKLPGNAELVEVHADHVVLRRAGVLEALRFPKTEVMIDANPNEDNAEKAVTTAKPAAQVTPEQAPPAATAEEAVEQFRDRLDDDAEGALASLGVEAVSNSGAEGYKLGALANSPFLRNTGLLPGDLLLSVNGQPVGDPGADQLQLDSLLEQGSARMEIQRGKRRFFVTASLR